MFHLSGCACAPAAKLHAMASAGSRRASVRTIEVMLSSRPGLAMRPFAAVFIVLFRQSRTGAIVDGTR